MSRNGRNALGALSALAVVCLAAIAGVSTARFASAAGPSATFGDVASDRAHVLDALFMSLKSAKTDAEAEVVVARIWEIWLHSDRPGVNRIMDDGIGFLAIQEFGAAYDQFNKVVEAAPDFAEGWNKRATALYLMNEHEQSLSDIEKVLALEPRHFGALAGRGMIHAQGGRWNEALASYRQAVAVNPFFKEAMTVIRVLERRVGERPL